MKLFFLSHDGNCSGGAQKCLVDLLKGIKQKSPGCQIYMVFPNQGTMLEACAPYISGYEIIRLDWWLLGDNNRITIKKKISFIRRTGKTVLKLINYLHKVKPDFGITNTIVVPQLAFACRLLCIKHLWFLHEVPTVTWSDSCFMFNSNRIFRLVDVMSSKIIVPSDYAKRYYENYISGNKIYSIDQAVELDLPAVLPCKAHRQYTVLLVGAFDSNKGQLELLLAIKRIVDEGKSICCYLVGSDVGFMDKCKEYVSLNHLDDYISIVAFTAQIQSYYFCSDVLVVCSAMETFGRVSVEAQKCGLPVILSNVGANPERVKDRITGLLYSKGNVDDLVEKIESLRDAAKRSQFKERIAASDLSRYSILNFASEFQKLLK